MCHQPSDVYMTHNAGTVQNDIDSTCTERIVVQGATELQHRRFVLDRPSQCARYLWDIKVNCMGSRNNGFTLC